MNSDFGWVHKLSQAYTNALGSSYSNISPEIFFFLKGAIIFSITLGFLRAALVGGFEEVVHLFASKILLIGWTLFLINNWPAITNDIAAGMVMLGFEAAGTTSTSTNFLNDPFTIIKDGFNLMSGLMTTAVNMPLGLTSGFHNLPIMFFYMVAAVIAFLAYIAVMIQIIVTIVEFKLGSLGAALLLGFQVWDKTAFLAERCYGYMVSGGLKLFGLALIVGIGLNFMGQLTVGSTPDLNNAAAVLAGSLIVMVIALVTPKAIGGLITGSPQLSGSDIKGAASTVASGAASAATAPVQAASLVAGGVGAVKAGFEAMKRAATVGGADANNSTLAQIAKAANAGVGSTSGQNAGSSTPADT
jgi:type IV secretion system protein TrbL